MKVTCYIHLADGDYYYGEEVYKIILQIPENRCISFHSFVLAIHEILEQNFEDCLLVDYKMNNKKLKKLWEVSK